MRTWKQELHWLTRRAYYRGFVVGVLAGVGITLSLIVWRQP